jgi:hypothetical protein
MSAARIKDPPIGASIPKNSGPACSCYAAVEMPRLFQDDLPATPRASRLSALGMMMGDRVVVAFVADERALARSVRITGIRLWNGGVWSYFVCPERKRKANVLRLLDGRPMCRRCCLSRGVPYRIAAGSSAERAEARARRIERLRKLLEGGPARLHPRPGRTLDRRGALKLSLRRAMIAARQELFKVR